MASPGQNQTGRAGRAPPEFARVCAVFWLLAAVTALADGGREQGHHSAHAAAPVTESTVAYETPDITLTRADGRRVSLARELDDGRPVLLNFIFTTCTSICPLASQTFAEFQQRLGPEAGAVHLMSISIDPEQDTPARLRAYAKRFHAGPSWQYYTGSVAASVAAQQAFDVYRGNKMSHAAVTLMRAAPGKPWLRIEGFVTPEQLLRHYRTLLATR
jgi:protein SCO1/2